LMSIINRSMTDVVGQVASMTTESDALFIQGTLAKAQSQLIMRNAKAHDRKVKAEAVRMPALGGVKRKLDAEGAGEKVARGVESHQRDAQVRW